MGFTKEMFSPPRVTRKVLEDNDSEVIGTAKPSTDEIPSPSRQVPEPSESESRFQLPSKIRSLPTVWKELELTADAYQHMKSEYPLLGVCSSATEVVVRVWSWILMFIAFSPPLSSTTECVLDKFHILDEFSCHQLDFLEEQLTKNEYGSIYRTGGLAERLERCVRLIFRVVFIWPRLCMKMFYACVDCLGEEFTENVELLSDIVSPPTKVRMSARLNKNRRQKPQKSPGKKRKIAEVTEEESGALPYYFEERVEYVEEEDADFVPNPAEEDSEDDIDTQEEEEDTQEEEEDDTQEEDEEEDDDEEEEENEEEEQASESCKDEVDENENKPILSEKFANLKPGDALLSSAIACPLPETPTL